MNHEQAASPLDPQLAAIVAGMRAAKAPPPFSGTPEKARARMQHAVMAGGANTMLPEVGSVEDAVAHAEGLEVPVRVYRPREASAPLPTVLFFHGGGFVLGSIELGYIVANTKINIDYRILQLATLLPLQADCGRMN